MKKILIIGLLLIFTSIANAYQVGQFQAFRSSETGTADSNVLISTGSIFVPVIEVSSAAPNSTLTLFNSTSTDVGVSRSTSTAYHLDVERTIIVSEEYSRGLLYTTTGTAKIRILWDYIITVPKGFEGKSRK